MLARRRPPGGDASRSRGDTPAADRGDTSGGGRGNARAVHRRLLTLAPDARRLLGGAIAAGVVGAVALVVQAAALAAIVAGMAFGDGASSTAFIALGAAFAIRAATGAATEWLGRSAASQALAALRRRVAEHVLAARTPRVEDARRGELATAAVHGVDALGEYYAKAVPQLALAAVVPPGLVMVVLWHDPVVGGLLALTLPLVVVFMVLVGRASAERIAERRVALGVLGTHFLDVVRGLPTLRAHGRAEAQAETLGAIGERYRLESVAALRVAFLSALVLELLAMVGTAIAAAVVGVQLAGGALDFRTGLFVLLLAPEVYVPLRLAGQRYHAAEDGAAAATALLELLDAAVPRRTGAPGGDPAREPIVVRGVSMAGGAGRPPSLDGLDATFAPGRITGLVGASGAGKSTLLALLAALREPDDGTITCGGAPLGGEAWWPRVAWLGQRPALLRGPLRDTLTLQREANGRPPRGGGGQGESPSRGKRTADDCRRAAGAATIACSRRASNSRFAAPARSRSWPGLPRAWTPSSAPAGGHSRAGRRSGSRWRARCSRPRRCFCSTSRPRTSIPKPPPALRGHP